MKFLSWNPESLIDHKGSLSEMADEIQKGIWRSLRQGLVIEAEVVMSATAPDYEHTGFKTAEIVGVLLQTFVP
jgi:hypothetical protein